MALKYNQIEVDLDTLYACDEMSENRKMRIAIDAGSINVYGSDKGDVPTALSEMTVIDSDVSGIYEFDIVPSYLAFVQNIDTTASIILTNVSAVDLGDIS